MLRILLIAICVVLFLDGCYYDTKEVLYPTPIQAICDTTTITYVANIVPILSTSCNSCHSIASASSLGGNIVTEGYSNFSKVVSGGRLMGSLLHSSGFAAMPKSANALTNCNIAFIQRWINAGSLNN